jgi:hypothetical protein
LVNKDFINLMIYFTKVDLILKNILASLRLLELI